MDNDEELLQFAVRQSLLESGGTEEDQVNYNFYYNYTLRKILEFVKIF